MGTVEGLNFIALQTNRDISRPVDNVEDDDIIAVDRVNPESQ